MKIDARRMATVAMVIVAMGATSGCERTRPGPEAAPRAEALGLHEESAPGLHEQPAPGLHEESATGLHGETTTAPQAESASHTEYEGVSIYALDSAFTDQDERAVRLKDLAGKVVVAAMTYTSCQAVCPRIVSDMQAIEHQLPDHARNGVQFVLFSLDPARDTPEARRRFSKEHQLSEHWQFLAGSDDDVRDLAAVLGMKYQREDNGDIAHSALIVVLDRTGVVRHRQAGLSDDNTAILAAIAAAR